MTFVLCFMVCDISNAYTWNDMNEIIFITLLIYVSDFLDGKLARKWNVCSKFGEMLDVGSDLFYMVSQCFLLCIRGIMPIYVIGCILLEFLIFMITSQQINGVQQEKVFCFEKLGRIMAVFYYALPLLFLYQNVMYRNVIEIICLLGTLLACGNRLVMVKKSQAWKKSMVVLRETNV